MTWRYRVAARVGGLLAVLLWMCLAAPGPVQAEEEFSQQWLYCPTNLLVVENVDRLCALWERAAAAGYTHVLLSDSKFCRLAEMPERYFEHARRVRETAQRLNLQIVPSVFPLGYSNDLLSQNPNLAEGLPVRDVLLEVQDGVARCVADPPVALPGGGMDDLSLWSWKDDAVTADAGAARLGGFEGNARIVQKLRLAPFRQYHVALRIKTQEFTGKLECKLLTPGGRSLSYSDLAIQTTQDYAWHHVVFNSLDNEEVNLYLGCWGGGQGALWIDEVQLEEVAFLNLLRRTGAPLVVRRDGPRGKPLREGVDFEPLADPRLGNQPYGGEYEIWHEPPLLHTKLPDGTRLRASYYHPVTIYGGQVMVSLAERETRERLREQARQVHALWQSEGYLMAIDEIRVLNWDAACAQLGFTAGELLADATRFCTQTLREVNPGGHIYVWSDMFDPYHNAVDDYYLVKDSLRGAWEGLDPEVIVVAWYFERRAESLQFFRERGNPLLLAGFYDGPVEPNVRGWVEAGRAAGGVQGLMYTTWTNDYSELEAFAEIYDAARE